MTTRTLNLQAKVLSGVLASFCAVAPFHSRAAEAPTQVSRKVSYAGIDLNTPAGADALYGRLKSAARSVCGASDPVYRAPSWVYRDCMQKALVGALRTVNRPLLTQAFVSDYGMEAAAQFGIKLAAK